MVPPKLPDPVYEPLVDRDEVEELCDAEGLADFMDRAIGEIRTIMFLQKTREPHKDSPYRVEQQARYRVGEILAGKMKFHHLPEQTRLEITMLAKSIRESGGDCNPRDPQWIAEAVEIIYQREERLYGVHPERDHMILLLREMYDDYYLPAWKALCEDPTGGKDPANKLRVTDSFFYKLATMIYLHSGIKYTPAMARLMRDVKKL